MSNIRIHDLAHTIELDDDTLGAQFGGFNGTAGDVLRTADAGSVALLPPFGRLGNEKADFGLTIYA